MHIPIHIPIGARHNAIVRAQTLKLISCENCQQRYAFLLDLEARGSDIDLLFLDSSGSKERAVAQAKHNLAAKTRNSLTTIPCPECGFYQADMVRQLKEDASTNPTQVVGAIVFLLAFIPLALAISFAWFVTACTAIVGLVILAYGYLLSARFDPNAGDPAPRKVFAQKITVWGEQLAKMLEENAGRAE